MLPSVVEPSSAANWLANWAEGVLSFPVTPFDRAGEVAVDVLGEHVRAQAQEGPLAVFVCCGTGEFFSLTAGEYAACVVTAVSAAAGRVPVVAGVGYGTALAVEYAAAAAEAGVDGLLVLPPYLVKGPPAGLVAHYRAIAETTSLPLVIYQRDNAKLTPTMTAELSSIPNIVGLKDGMGDLDHLAGLMRALRRSGRQLLIMNGTPTAEVNAAAYRKLGVTVYSSGVFSFAPEVALAFNTALRKGDSTATGTYMDEFFHPLVQLRDRVPGYPVSLVKAGVRLRGLDVGGVRPPLVDPTPEHRAELERLIQRGLDLAGSR